MGRVSWSAQAEADLESIGPAVRDELRRNAEETLHEIPPHPASPADEGVDGGIMWHRGGGHDEFTEQENGPQNYFLFYRKRQSAPGFEVLAVRSVRQVAADAWAQMARKLSDA